MMNENIDKYYNVVLKLVKDAGKVILYLVIFFAQFNGHKSVSLPLIRVIK